MKDIYNIVAEFRKRPEKPFALATMVGAEGSSYRRPGARMLICHDGRTIGSLSGGCIEDEIVARARSVLESGQPMVMSFDTRRRFGCHGQIEIFIEKLKPSFLTDLARYIDARRVCIALTTVDGSCIVLPADEDCALPNEQGTAVSPAAAGPALGLVRGSGDRRSLEKREANSFPYSSLVQEIHPRIRLLIFGEGPDSVPLQELCESLGWEAFEIDDTKAFASEPDRWTAAIVKSHNYGRDFAALARLLPLNLRYVGLIGPKKRRDQLVHDLFEIGVGMNAGFFAPAGLDLNAETPEEIALSVVSEIQRVFAEGSGQSLRDRKQPIHGAKNPHWRAAARPSLPEGETQVRHARSANLPLPQGED